MYYFWFIPVLAVMAVLTWAFYLVIARKLPKVSDRSVEDALADERHEAEDKTRAA